MGMGATDMRSVAGPNHPCYSHAHGWFFSGKSGFYLRRRSQTVQYLETRSNLDRNFFLNKVLTARARVSLPETGFRNLRTRFCFRVTASPSATGPLFRADFQLSL